MRAQVCATGIAGTSAVVQSDEGGPTRAMRPSGLFEDAQIPPCRHGPAQGSNDGNPKKRFTPSPESMPRSPSSDSGRLSCVAG